MELWILLEEKCSDSWLLDWKIISIFWMKSWEKFWLSEQQSQIKTLNSATVDQINWSFTSELSAKNKLTLPLLHFLGSLLNAKLFMKNMFSSRMIQGFRQSIWKLADVRVQLVSTTIRLRCSTSGRKPRIRTRVLRMLAVTRGAVPLMTTMMASSLPAWSAAPMILSTFASSVAVPLVSLRPGVSMKEKLPPRLL